MHDIQANPPPVSDLLPALSPAVKDRLHYRVSAAPAVETILVMLTAHAILLLFLFLDLWFYIPGYRELFMSFRMPLPGITTFFFAISDWMSAHPFMAAVFFPLLLAIDGAVLFGLCLRANRHPSGVLISLRWFWFIIILMVLFSSIFAVRMPFIRLFEGIRLGQ